MARSSASGEYVNESFENELNGQDMNAIQVTIENSSGEDIETRNEAETSCNHLNPLDLIVLFRRKLINITNSV
jgi:hypothetical protein